MIESLRKVYVYTLWQDTEYLSAKICGACRKEYAFKVSEQNCS
jgi:hypothetical protein